MRRPLLFAIVAATIGAEASDAHQQAILQDDHPPNVASFVVMAGYDEPGKNSGEPRRDPMMGTSTIITKSQAACHSQADVDRLIQFAEVKDGRGTATFLAQRIAANECIILMLGDTVRIDATADLSNRVCVLPQGQRTCFWTLSSGVDLKSYLNR
jgi:hypothetical protein